MALCQSRLPPALSLELGIGNPALMDKDKCTLAEGLRLQREKAAWLINHWRTVTGARGLYGHLANHQASFVLRNEQEEGRDTCCASMKT